MPNPYAPGASCVCISPEGPRFNLCHPKRHWQAVSQIEGLSRPAPEGRIGPFIAKLPRIAVIAGSLP